MQLFKDRICGGSPLERLAACIELAIWISTELFTRLSNPSTHLKTTIHFKARRVRVFFRLVVATRYKNRYRWLHSGYTGKVGRQN